jgi:hypothetical protein
VKAHGYGDRYTIVNNNILDVPLHKKADIVICQEVLEHLEDPLSFIKALRDMAQPSGWGYITAAINAAHTDHIYLYRSPDEVKSQIEEAGWVIEHTQIEQNPSFSNRRFIPTIVGYLLRNHFKTS